MATSEPLAGVRIVVTRASEQVSSLARALNEYGATVIEVPTIAIVDASDRGQALRQALTVERLGELDWLVVTSPNGADRVVAAAADIGSRLRDTGTRLAVVGPGTEAAIARHGVRADLVPERFVAEGLIESFPPPPPSGGRVLLAQAAGARPVLAQGLAARGWKVEQVEAYRTIHPPVPPELLAETATAEAITFTSASTVRGWVAAAGAEATPATVISIGPITSVAARELGLEIAAEADPHTIDGLIAAVIAALAHSE